MNYDITISKKSLSQLFDGLVQHTKHTTDVYPGDPERGNLIIIKSWTIADKLEVEAHRSLERSEVIDILDSVCPKQKIGDEDQTFVNWDNADLVTLFNAVNRKLPEVCEHITSWEIEVIEIE